MASSPARVAANRRNALQSTGPRTAEGKAVSRRNAFQHGLAGSGDLLTPDEDSAIVAARAAAFAGELRADCAVSRALAHRAALLSIRMERASVRDMVAVAERVKAARSEFDQDRLDAVNDLIEAVEGDGEVRPALGALEASPEGVDYLLDYWGTLLEAVRSVDDFQANRAARQAMLGIGSEDEEFDTPENDEVAERIEAEVARLQSVVEAMTPLFESIAADRQKAGLLASFDPSPAATLARRYEAAAERGMYRAIKTIAEIRRARSLDHPAVEAPIPAPVAPPPKPIAIPPLPEPEAKTAPLGSFRVEGLSAARQVANMPKGWVEKPLTLEARPKKRPDLRKLVASGR